MTEAEESKVSVIQPAGTKRTQDSVDGPASKKANTGDGDENKDLSVKILIPSAAVGAIIGKGGEAMRNMKTECQCRVQMSKNSETYPGTSERICLVKGRLANVVNVIQQISDKIREKCEGVTGGDAFDHKGVSRANEVKIVMPNTSAGMVIGKAGANIKDIRETFGCQIQVFPKAGSSEAKSSLERIVTLAQEDAHQLIQAVGRVLERVASDPHHCSEINKEDFGGAQKGGSGGGGGGFSGANSSFSSQQSGNFNAPAQQSFGAPAGGQFGGFQGNNNNNNNSNFKFNPLQGLGNNDLLSFLDNLQSTLRSSGFNEQSVQEIMQAMNVLAKYNIMGLGLGLGVAAMAQMRTGQEGQQGSQPQNLPSNHGAAGFGAQGYPNANAPQEVGQQRGYWRR